MAESHQRRRSHNARRVRKSSTHHQKNLKKISLFSNSLLRCACKYIIFRLGRTLTSPVKLIKCLAAIREHAFVASDYPVIITLEDHLTQDLQAKVAQVCVFTVYLFGMLCICSSHLCLCFRWCTRHSEMCWCVQNQTHFKISPLLSR